MRPNGKWFQAELNVSSVSGDGEWLGTVRARYAEDLGAVLTSFRHAGDTEWGPDFISSVGGAQAATDEAAALAGGAPAPAPALVPASGAGADLAGGSADALEGDNGSLVHGAVPSPAPALSGEPAPPPPPPPLGLQPGELTPDVYRLHAFYYYFFYYYHFLALRTAGVPAAAAVRDAAMLAKASAQEQLRRALRVPAAPSSGGGPIGAEGAPAAASSHPLGGQPPPKKDDGGQPAPGSSGLPLKELRQRALGRRLLEDLLAKHGLSGSEGVGLVPSVLQIRQAARRAAELHAAPPAPQGGGGTRLLREIAGSRRLRGA